MPGPLRTLLVEDSVDDADLLTWELRRGGYEPQTLRVSTAADFTAALDSQPWDVILCDYVMPGFSGAGALALVRRRTLDIPFIFVSGTLSEEMAVAAMRAGAHDFIVKDRLKRLVPAIEREVRDAGIRRQQALDRAEREALERRFRQILALAPDAIVAADEDFRVTIFNRAAETVFGYSSDEVAGMPLDILLPPRFTERHRHHMTEMAAPADGLRRHTEHFDVIGRRKDGSEFPAESSIARLVEGGHTTFMAVIRDVSERHALEAQLRQAQRMEAVGQLTGGLAHDFNNLLTIVIGNLDLLLERIDKTGDAAEMARLALDASLRGATLTRQLLAFSRRQPLEPKAFDMNALVSDTIGLLRRTLGQQLEIETRFAPDLLPVLADPAQLESAFANLAINARDAMPEGGRLTIETANKQLDEEYAMHNVDVAAGDYVMLAVTDNGSGIAAEFVDKVFEPFFTTKEPGQGTGLGLSMVYGFAKQSGGHVKIYSELGHGTTVRLYLPCADADRQRSDVKPCQPAEVLTGDATILVVEDSAEVRRVAVNHLLAFGYRVIESGNGREALVRLAENEEIDLLFTDVVMPGGLSGPELARQARALRPNLKVLFTSGYAESAIDGGLPDGLAGNLLSKPYRREELSRKLRQVLETEEGEG
jgi:two-component system, cell cycle sensor histidine kinase and response regulator CckA